MSEEKPNKKNPPVRYKWHEFILYPDNRYHLELLNHFKANEQCFFIKHDADVLKPKYGVVLTEEDKEQVHTKPHYHVALYWSTQSTQDAMIKRFGFHATFYKTADGKLSTFPTLYGTEVHFTLNKTICRPIKCISSYAEYLTHSDFKSQVLGKKQYSVNDIQLSENAPQNMYNKYLAEKNEKCDSGHYIQIAYTLAVNNEDSDGFLIDCMTYPDENFISWFLKNHNFVKSFIIHGRYDRNNITEYVNELTQILKQQAEEKEKSEKEWIQIL